MTAQIDHILNTNAHFFPRQHYHIIISHCETPKKLQEVNLFNSSSNI